MSDDLRFEEAARRWLEQGPATAPDRVIGAVLLAVQTTPQVRGRRAPWRTTRMLALASTLAAISALLILGAGPLGLLPATNAPAVPTLPPTTCPAGTPLPSGTIATIAGTGEVGSDGDGGPATRARLSAGWGIAVAEDGAVYFTDQYARSVRRIGTDGIISTVASEATGARFMFPAGLAIDPEGVLFVTDGGASKIYRVEEDGSATVVVGTGVPGTSGNDGPATQAEVQPVGLAIGPGGDLYFDDVNNFRRVDADGIIHAFAGSTTPGWGGDGGPATSASFGQEVMGLATDRQGNVYLGDPGNARIRRVDVTGTISTIAGGGQDAVSDRDARAIDAALTRSPYGIATDGAGSVYFSEWQANSVRRIGPDGTLRTLVGPRSGFAGDCGPATSAAIERAQGIAVHEGVLYLVDADNRRIRMLIL